MVIELAFATTMHFIPGEWNETHPSVRLEHEGWTVGAFQNSEGNLSIAGGRVWRDGPLFLEMGLTTGYEVAPVVPMVRAGVEYENVRAFVIPAATVEGDIGVAVGVEYVFLKF